MLSTLLISFVIGIVFGITLEKSKVMEGSAIIGQFLFKRFIMLKVFITAMIISMIILNAMHYMDSFTFKLKDLNLFSNILGGSLLGIGIALSGTCPGTVFAQMGVGYKDAFFTFSGGLIAAYIYLFLRNKIGCFLETWTLGKVQLSDITGFPVWSLAIGIVIVLIIFLFILEKKYKWQNEAEMLDL